MSRFFVRGTILQAASPTLLEIREDSLLEIIDGVIMGVYKASARADILSDKSLDVHKLTEGTYLLPGLIDCHIHAPQWPQLGIGLDIPLERWLFEYTFPLESRFRDVDYAHRVWREMVPSLLSEGTTTAVYYSSIHNDATSALAQTCLEFGQRAFVGRVAMDCKDGTPEYYRDPSSSEGVALSRESINSIKSLDAGRCLVFPIITPRFTPSCSDSLLIGLGNLAMETETRVQTHCSESDWEHETALDRFGVSDTSALKNFNLLKKNTVLAHCNHTDTCDWDTMLAHGAGIAHCPLSNAYFAGAILPVRRVIEHGLNIGLGTDISGGSDPSLLAQCEHALNASKILEFGVDSKRSQDTRGVPKSSIDVVTAFWMATRGAANLLGLDIGKLDIGMPFDAISVRDLGAGYGTVLESCESLILKVLERILRRSRRSQVLDVWVAGTRVSGTNVT